MWSSYARSYRPSYSRGRYGRKSYRGSGQSVGLARARLGQRTTPRGPVRRGPLRAQVKSLQSVVSKNLPEVKFLDGFQSFTNIGDPGSIDLITEVAEGTGIGQRIGDEIRVKNIAISGRFLANAVVQAAVGSAYRLAVVVDKQQVSDTNPAVSDIFDPVRPEALNVSLNALKSFKVLWMSQVFYPNMMHINSNISSLGAPTQGFAFEHNIVCDIKVRFNGPLGTDIESNGIYFCIISTDTNDTLDVDSYYRVGYIDA